MVATVLTVYGIETKKIAFSHRYIIIQLQQYLPFTVLKHGHFHFCTIFSKIVATVLTVYGIETI